MTPERWGLGLVPCTATKNPTGTSPLSLYRGTGFSMNMQHALQRCDRILIMSAKFGLIDPTAKISWYDTYLGNLSAQMRARLVVKVREQIDPEWANTRVLSYLPNGYHELMLEANPEVVSTFRRPYKTLGMLTRVMVLSNEIKMYGKSPARR